MGEQDDTAGPTFFQPRLANNGWLLVYADVYPASEKEVERVDEASRRGKVHEGAAVMQAIDQLKLRELFGAQCNRQADLVTGMIAACVLAPHTKPATRRSW